MARIQQGTQNILLEGIKTPTDSDSDNTAATKGYAQEQIILGQLNDDDQVVSITIPDLGGSDRTVQVGPVAAGEGGAHIIEGPGEDPADLPAKAHLQFTGSTTANDVTVTDDLRADQSRTIVTIPTGYTRITTVNGNPNGLITTPVHGQIAFDAIQGTYWVYEAQSNPALSRFVRLATEFLSEVDDVDIRELLTNTSRAVTGTQVNASKTLTVVSVDVAFTGSNIPKVGNHVFFVNPAVATDDRFREPFIVQAVSANTVTIAGDYDEKIPDGYEVHIANVAEMFLRWNPETSTYDFAEGGGGGTAIEPYDPAGVYELGDVVVNIVNGVLYRFVADPPATNGSITTPAVWQSIGGATQFAPEDAPVASGFSSLGIPDDTTGARLLLSSNNVQTGLGTPNDNVRIYGTGGIVVSAPHHGTVDILRIDGSGVEIPRFDDSAAWEAQDNITLDLNNYISTDATYSATQANTDLVAAGYSDGDQFFVLSRDTTYQVISTSGNLALQFILTNRDSVADLAGGQGVLDDITLNAEHITENAFAISSLNQEIGKTFEQVDEGAVSARVALRSVTDATGDQSDAANLDGQDPEYRFDAGHVLIWYVTLIDNDDGGTVADQLTALQQVVTERREIAVSATLDIDDDNINNAAVFHFGLQSLRHQSGTIYQVRAVLVDPARNDMFRMAFGITGTDPLGFSDRIHIATQNVLFDNIQVLETGLFVNLGQDVDLRTNPDSVASDTAWEAYVNKVATGKQDSIIAWATGTAYEVGDYIYTSIGNLRFLWRCRTAHTSDNTAGGEDDGQPRFNVDTANWDQIGPAPITEWVTGLTYQTGDAVLYVDSVNAGNSGVFQRLSTGTDAASSDNPSANHADWIRLEAGSIAASSLYQANLLALYPTGAEVIFNGIFYERTNDATLPILAPDADTYTDDVGQYWIRVGSVDSGHVWHNTANYIAGDLVDLNNILYIATQPSGPAVTSVGPKTPLTEANVFYGDHAAGAPNTAYWRIVEAGLETGYLIPGTTEAYTGVSVARRLAFNNTQFSVTTLETETQANTGHINIQLVDGGHGAIPFNNSPDNQADSEDGNVLLRFGEGGTRWGTSPITTLNSVGNVTIDDAQADEILRWNGAAWVNSDETAPTNTSLIELFAQDFTPRGVSYTESGALIQTTVAEDTGKEDTIILNPLPPTDPAPVEGDKWQNSTNSTIFTYLGGNWIHTAGAVETSSPSRLSYNTLGNIPLTRLPTIVAANAEQILKVNADGTAWTLAEDGGEGVSAFSDLTGNLITDQLPVVTAANDGQVLQVDGGKWELISNEAGNNYAALGNIPLVNLPTVTTANAQQILKVNAAGNWAFDVDDGPGTTNFTDLVGTLATTQLPTGATADNQVAIWNDPGGAPSAWELRNLTYGDITGTVSYSDLSGTIPLTDLPTVTSAQVSQILKVDSSGNWEVTQDDDRDPRLPSVPGASTLNAFFPVYDGAGSFDGLSSVNNGTFRSRLGLPSQGNDAGTGGALTGATVVSNITSSSGFVNTVSTRDLTATDVGAVATDTITNTGITTILPTQRISQLVINSQGLITSRTVANTSPTDFGAISIEENAQANLNYSKAGTNIDAIPVPNVFRTNAQGIPTNISFDTLTLAEIGAFPASALANFSITSTASGSEERLNFIHGGQIVMQLTNSGDLRIRGTLSENQNIT